MLAKSCTSCDFLYIHQQMNSSLARWSQHRMTGVWTVPLRKCSSAFCSRGSAAYWHIWDSRHLETGQRSETVHPACHQPVCFSTHQVVWWGGSQASISLDSWSNYTPSPGARRTRSPRRGRGPRSQQPFGQRRLHTPCCRSHCYGHKLSLVSCRPPENRVLFRYFCPLYVTEHLNFTLSFSKNVFNFVLHIWFQSNNSWHFFYQLRFSKNKLFCKFLLTIEINTLKEFVFTPVLWNPNCKVTYWGKKWF